MPWLSFQPSAISDSYPKPSSRQSSHRHLQKASNVSFIPAQIDGLCGTSPLENKQTPWHLLMSDLRVLLHNIPCIPSMTRAMCSTKVIRNSLRTVAGVRDVVLLCSLATMQICMMVMAPVVFMILPGLVFTLCMTTCWAITLVMIYSLKGSRALMSSRDSLTSRDDYSDERWIFINSMGCSHRAMQMHCNRLSRTFNRRVTGIHNRSNGLILDIMETLLQRCFGIPMPCTTTLTSHLRDACVSNSVQKVILIGHGTGALHISLALDRLHTDLPIPVLSKLEVYTFGSCASHLSNPALRMETYDPSSPMPSSSITSSGNDKYTRPNGAIASPVKSALGSLGHRVEDRERVIPHIEHYALASDIFARCGILHAVRNKLDTRFCGRVFVLDDSNLNLSSSSSSYLSGGGFMFQEHYLDLLFPEDSERGLYGSEVIDQVVEVDVATAEKREFTAQGVALPLKNLSLGGAGGIAGMRTPTKGSPDVSPRRVRGKKEISRSRSGSGGERVSSGGSTGSMSGYGNGAGGEKRRSWGTAGAMGIDGVGRARVGAKECEGRTVRQLSRMWRYENGDRPVGEGVPVCNGVGMAGQNQNGDTGMAQ